MSDAKVLPFPRDRHADLRIDFVDPGPIDGLTAEVAGRVPPQNLAAERAVLGAILAAPVVLTFRPSAHDAAEVAAAATFRESALVVALRLLKPEHFYSEANGRIFQAIQQLAIEKVPVDATTTGAWIAEHEWTHKIGGAAYLRDLSTDAPTRNIEAHCAIVLECWERRTVIATCQRVMAAEYGNGDPWGPRKAKIRSTFGQITAPIERLVGAPIGEAASEAHASVQASQNGAEPGVPWGFAALDGFGLLGQGKQHVLAGRPGMGKTALAFQNATRIAATELDAYSVGEAVYWCTWEMKASDLLEREACSLAGVPYKLVQRRRVDADGMALIAWQLGHLRNLPIWIDDQRCPPAELAARVRAVKSLFERGAARRFDGALYPKCRLRNVVIDQLSEVPPPLDTPKGWQKRDVVGATSKAIQQEIAKKLDVATLLLCQLARPQIGTKVGPPTLHELRESGQIEEGADEVFAIHRRQYYEGARTPAEWKNVAEILPLKGRYGQADDALMGFYGGQFSDKLPAASKGVPYYE